jgi:hypothetical protein
MKKTLYLLLLFVLASFISNTQASESLHAPKPTLEFGAPLDRDAYKNSASEIGHQVDDIKNGTALLGSRTIINIDSVDKCIDEKVANDFFSEQISYYASKMIEDVPAMVGTIGEYYGTSSNDADYFPTSLIRHPLCHSTSATLSKTINKVPKQSTIDRLNIFADEVNSLRSAVLAGDHEAKKELLSTWTRLFSCLAYTESLSNPDSAPSQKVAKKVAPSGYRRPAGVEFYDDPAQDEVSRLNIGMFQFTPNSTGNIQPCLRAWNALHASKPACQVNTKASKNDLIKVLGSSLQSFNAFCGVHKLVQTFAIQVNTVKVSATHPDNIVNGKFKSEEQRCVSPHFQAGKAYNHFGPLQNSTGTNLETVFACVDSSR